MSTIDEIFATISEEDVSANIDELLVIDPTTRQISLPSSELIFGVESDSHSERKYFHCSRYVGDNVDLASCFIRVNYRNANGEIDSHLVEDVTVKGDSVVFSWELHEKVTLYRGQVQFLVCAYRADKVEWNTTVSSGVVLEGIEPDVDGAVAETGDLVAQLLTMVAAQTEAVKAEGATQIAEVKASAKATEAEILNEIQAKGTNTLASIPNDYTALGEAVGALERMAAPGIVCEAEGTSIVVDDASNSPVQNLRIFGRSTQDGTPTPDNPVEIESVTNPVVTVCGKNLLPSLYRDGVTKTHGGLTYTVREDGSIHVGGVVTSAESYFVLSDFNFGEKSIAMGQSNGVYFWSDCLYNVAKHFTMIYFSKGKEVDQVYYPQVELGTVATSWESPSGQPLTVSHTLQGIPVTSRGNYTDSNGQQWICDEVDFERGVYVQRIRDRAFVGTETYSDYVSEDAISTAVWHIPNTPFFCTHAKENEGVRWANNRNITFTASRFSVASVEELKALFSKWSAEGSPFTIVYALETPIETPLTEAELASFKALHTNKPHTTVLNDQSAHIELSYVADTKLYIDRKIEAILG